MREADLRSRRFRQEREADWRRLEALLARAERGTVRRLSVDDMVAIPRLYRATLSSLAVARATSLDRALIDYLEALSSRAYFFVYGARSTPLARIRGFFAGEWPRAVQACGRETIVAALLLIGGAIAAFLLTTHDADWYYSFVPAELLQGRTPAATAEALRATLYNEEQRGGLSVFATFLFTHNARVALFAFALGFAFGLPTAMLLVYTGFMLGAFVALYAQHGLAFELIGWLMIHGVTELFAVILSGAAGFKIGWALAFPGDMTRLDAAGKAGKIAATVMVGVLAMLFVAGVLEGIARQSINNDLARYAIAIGTGLFWFGYFYAPIWRRPALGQS